MTPLLAVPWLDLAVGTLAVGTLAAGRGSDPARAFRVALAVSGLAFGLTLLSWAGFAAHAGPADAAVLRVDELTAPLVPLVALVHLLTVVATARSKMRRFSFARMLVGEALTLATFGCPADRPVWLVGLLVVGAVVPLVELYDRRQPLRLVALHLGLFAALLAGGQAMIETGGNRTLAAVLIAAAVLIRVGVVPFHGWVADVAGRASFGRAVLAVAPGLGLLAAVRLLVPVAPPEVSRGVAGLALGSAVLAAALATVQTDARRLFACLAVSYSGLALAGIGSGTAAGVTAGYAVWVTLTISLGGVGLTLRSVESRYGRLPLTQYRGLYDPTPALAVGFLVCGLAGVGFPGTVGFVAGELLADAAVEAGLPLALAAVAAAALNSIAVLRAYFLLFTGTTHPAAIPLHTTPRERYSVLALAGLVLVAGLVPQPWVATRARAAETALSK